MSSAQVMDLDFLRWRVSFGRKKNSLIRIRFINLIDIYMFYESKTQAQCIKYGHSNAKISDYISSRNWANSKMFPFMK